jgi:hypothetical protein
MRMTKKHAALSLVTTTSLIAGVALWPSVALAHSDKEGHSDGEVLEGSFVSERDEEAFIDHDGNRLPSLGDELIYTNSTTGTLGNSIDYGRCVFHRVDPGADSATLSCIATSEGPDGVVTLQGAAHIGLTSPVLLEPATWAITGGTGNFTGAEGELQISRFEGAGLDSRSFGTVRVVLDP